MPDFFKGLIDARGRPIEKKLLVEEVAGPTLTGVRSPLSGHPGDGLNPVRLASILREAEAGNPVRYLELAETIEERDLHLVGVLGHAGALSHSWRSRWSRAPMHLNIRSTRTRFVTG